MGEMGSFFDTAHDEAEWDARFGGGARQSHFAGAGDDLAMDFLGASSSAPRRRRATTRDDLNLPDQAMEDLLGRIAGDRLPEGGGARPLDARDSHDAEEARTRRLPPLPLDESDEDEDAPYRPDDTDAEAGTGTGTGTASARST